MLLLMLLTLGLDYGYGQRKGEEGLGYITNSMARGSRIMLKRLRSFFSHATWVPNFEHAKVGLGHHSELDSHSSLHTSISRWHLDKVDNVSRMSATHESHNGRYIRNRMISQKSMSIASLMWRAFVNPNCCYYYPGQKNWDNLAHVAQARDLSSMHAPMFGLRGCLNFFGQGSSNNAVHHEWKTNADSISKRRFNILDFFWW